MNLNNVIIVGRLSMNPVLKSFKKNDGSDGHRTFFRVAVTRAEDLGKDRKEQRTDFIPVVSWGEAAKRHAEFLEVGTEVTVMGRFRVDQIKGEGQEKPVDNIVLEARTIQYGQKSKKNRAAETDSDEPSPAMMRKIVAALKARGEDVPAAAEAAAEEPKPIAQPSAANPFLKQDAQAGIPA